jgi:phosphocarrier protein HPr
MSDKAAEKRVCLVNSQGLHLRPADMFVRMANRFSSEVQVGKGDQLVDGKSILSILTLAAEAGVELRIVAIGEDASKAVEALAELIGSGFAEDVQDGTQLAGEH